MDARPPADAGLGVQVPPSPALEMESAADTSLDSAPLSTETTAESVALSPDTTIESVEMSSESAGASVNMDSASTLLIEEIVDNASGKVELTDQNPTVIVNMAPDSDCGVIELPSDGVASSFQSLALPAEEEVEELTIDCSTDVDGPHCRRSTEGTIDLASDSDFETVILSTDSAMALEDTFGDNPAGVVEISSDDDLEIVELETERPEDVDGSSERSSVPLGAPNNDDSTRGSLRRDTEGANRPAGPRTTGPNDTSAGPRTTDPNDTLAGPRFNGPNNSMGPKPRGPKDSLEPSNDGPSGSTHDNDQDRTTGIRSEGAAAQVNATSPTWPPLTRPLPPLHARSWVQLLSPQWTAFLLATWEVSSMQLARVLWAVRRHIATQWSLWNRVLIPLISGRGSGCCPRNLIFGMSPRAFVVMADNEDIGGPTGGDAVDVTSTTDFDASHHLDFQLLVTVGKIARGSPSSSSWETLAGSSEESLSDTGSSDSFEDDFDDDDFGVVSDIPHPTFDAPADDLDGVDESDICKVCFCRRIARKAFGPCGHAQFCAVCISAYRPRSSCPICRRRIEMIINIY